MPHLMELHKLPSLWKDMQRLATVNRCDAQQPAPHKCCSKGNLSPHPSLHQRSWPPSTSR